MNGKDTLCSFCSIPASQNCGHCKKVYYCSKEHQKLHRKIHKEDCFPAILYKDPVIGQHWVATRDIQEGELIFNEYPIAVGPSGSLPVFRPICLGCLKFIGKQNYCSCCKWPVCNTTCEKEPFHALLECPILSKNKIPTPSKSIQYQQIFVLRCLLQRNLQPENWKLLITLESHVEERKGKKECTDAINSCVAFINKSCKLEDFDFETINYVYGAVQFNSYALERYLKGNGLGAQLFFKLGKLNHSCVENTNALDLEPKKGSSSISRGLSLVACMNICKGQALTQLYGDTLQGTYPRQRFLESEYYFTCRCDRCKSPNELGTNYSAVKCKSAKCAVTKNGYLLPLDPININSLWVCDQCHENVSYTNTIEKKIDEISLEMKALHNEIQKGTSNLEQQIKLNKQLEDFLGKNEGVNVHPNHYTLVPIKLRHLQETCEIFTALISSMGTKTKGKGSSAVKQVESRNKMKIDISNKINMAEEMLKVFCVLSPGNSPMQGLLHKFIEDYNNLSTSLLQDK